MDFQQKLRTQGASSFEGFADGRAMRLPVAGAIAQGETPMGYTGSVADYVRAGRELTTPFDAEHPPDMTRAAQIFTVNCQICHGNAGTGGGNAAQHGFPSPPSLLFGKAMNMRDGHIFHIISHGWRKMPAYGARLDIRDRWLAVAYVRMLQGRS
jgi:mono/diheme cytochrome c family protein